MSYEHDQYIRDASGRTLVSYGPRRVEGQSEHVEACTPAEATFWGVYAHDAKGEAQIVGDAHNAQSAQAFAKQVARTVELEAKLQAMRIVPVPNVNPRDVFAGINYKQLSELASTVTSKEGLSVAFDDDPFNASNPSQDRVTMRDVFGWSGQQNAFAQALQRELTVGQKTAAPSAPRVVVVTDGGVIQNIMSDVPVETMVVDYDWDGDDGDKYVDVPQTWGGVQKARVSLGQAEVNEIEVQSFSVLAAEASEWSPEPERYIVLSIDTNHAAFADLGTPYEVARILRAAAVKLELGTPFKDVELYDTNGNAVGRISAVAEPPKLDEPGMVHLVINAVDELSFGEAEEERKGLARTFHFLAEQLVGVNDMKRRFTAFTVETRTADGAISDVKVGHSYYREPPKLRAVATHGAAGLEM